jgi:hypothetical protein
MPEIHARAFHADVNSRFMKTSKTLTFACLASALALSPTLSGADTGSVLTICNRLLENNGYWGEIYTQSSALPIRNRLQWIENNGYCGETSIQECALYYGTYASQAYIRGVFDPAQQDDLVQVEEWKQVLARLGLKAEFFPTEKTPQPQYRRYATWMKQHLAARHPVITTCYIFEYRETDNPVDHFMTVTGFVGAEPGRYSDNDLFVFNDHYRSPAAYALQARWAFDTRSMAENGATYGIAIQKEQNYGLAITGTSNRSRHALPVQLELDRIDEPNLVNHEARVEFAATVTVKGLTPGKKYTLYRYNDPQKVPTLGYAAAPSDERMTFKATALVQTFPAKIPSDSVAVFRCLPAGE